MTYEKYEDFEAKAKAKYGEGPYYVTWCTGGVTGGNCWGGEANQSLTPDPEPELEMIDDILSMIMPSITFLEYRKIMKANVVEYNHYSQREYYGNSTDYCKKTLNLRALFDVLRELMDNK